MSKCRDAVLERDGYECQQCGHGGSKSNPLTVHHIVFRCQGGNSSMDNLITWCRDCHREFHRTHPVASKKKHKKKKGRRR